MKGYKCAYKHCVHPDELIPKEEVVQIGTRRYHKDCAYIRDSIERSKRIIFDVILPRADYVETIGVLNVLIFNKKFSPDFIEFMLMWLALRGAKIKSVYSLHYTVNNGFIKKDFNDPTKRQDVINRYAYRYG